MWFVGFMTVMLGSSHLRVMELGILPPVRGCVCVCVCMGDWEFGMHRHRVEQSMGPGAGSGQVQGRLRPLSQQK